MINNLKIKAIPVKGIPMEQIFKKIEAGKTITGFAQGDRHVLKIEMETDIDTIKKVVGYIQDLGMGEK